jgi:fructose-1,6-bisphosphatase
MKAAMIQSGSVAAMASEEDEDVVVLETSSQVIELP